MSPSQLLSRLQQLLNVAAPLGERVLRNGTRLIGKVPHVGSDAWLHVVYAGLSGTQLREVESKAGRPLPEDYQWFLRHHNGLSLYSGALFLTGLRETYARTGDAAWQPFSIEDANRLERPRAANPSTVFIGGYKADGSRLYMTPPDARVFRCERDSDLPLNEWPGLLKMLVSEVERLSLHFDEQGRRRDSRVSTAPAASPPHVA